MLSVLWTFGCQEPAEGMTTEDADTSDTESDAQSCGERFAEARCVGGGLPRFEVGDVELPDANAPNVTEVEGGILVEGMVGDVEVIYADESCVVACEWMLPQTTFCHAVDDQGQLGCTFGTDMLSLEACQDFVEGCG